MKLRFQGCASSGKATMIDFYNAEVVADGDVTVKSEEAATIAFTADCLSDPAKAGGSVSEYATLVYLD